MTAKKIKNFRLNLLLNVLSPLFIDFIKDVNPGILKALHVQDNDYMEDRHILPYTGKLNWEAIMKSLKKAEYTGDLTLEIIKFLDKFPNELLPETLKFAASVGKHLVTIYNG